MYQAVNTILEKYDAGMGAAEAHGMGAGMLCVELKADANNWLHELFADEHDLFDDESRVMLTLFEQTRALLEPEGDDFGFDLLLPDDEELLWEQVEALRCWCQGFLFGVGYAQTSADWPGDCAEVMRDLVELTKLDSDAEGEEDAVALMELHEYVRAAVLIVRDQFVEQNTSHVH